MKKLWNETCEFGYRIIWIEISDLSLLDSAEQALIKYFDPPLNTRDRLTRSKIRERNDYVQKIGIDLCIADAQVSGNLYCNGFPIPWLYKNELAAPQIEKILSSYKDIDWGTL